MLEDIAAWRAKDPIRRLERELLAQDALSQEEIDRLWQSARDEVQRAVEIAQSAPSCEAAGLGADQVFA